MTIDWNKIKDTLKKMKQDFDNYLKRLNQKYKDNISKIKGHNPPTRRPVPFNDGLNVRGNENVFKEGGKFNTRF